MIRLPFVILLLFETGISALHGQAAEPQWPQRIEVSGWYGQAICVALAEFRRHQGIKDEKGRPVYGELQHYTIQLFRTQEGVEVAFAPNNGPEDVKNHTVGGRSEYGIDVSYEISKRTLTIIKTSYGR